MRAVTLAAFWSGAVAMTLIVPDLSLTPNVNSHRVSGQGTYLGIFIGTSNL
jgi:hypothetical protein